MIPENQVKSSESYLSKWQGSFVSLLPRAVSDTFNPLILPPLLFIISLFLTGYGHHEIFPVFLISLLFFTVIPTLLIYYLRTKKYIQNYDISDRADRKIPFLIIIISYSLGFLVFSTWFSTVSQFPVFLTICYITNALIGFLITTKWKISIHSAGIASFCAVLFFLKDFHLMHDDIYLGNIFIWLSLILIPIIMWARVHLEEHTFIQTFIGALSGFFITYFELIIMIR